MVGFATGAAIIIALMQLDEFLGVPFEGVRNVFDELVLLLNFDFAQFSVASFLLAALALSSVVVGKKVAPKLPIPLIVLIVQHRIGRVWPVFVYR